MTFLVSVEAMIDASSPIPIHHQLAMLLRTEIDAGVYPPGTRLPTEFELCERHGVSRTPARRALVTLAEEGVIVRYRRRGSFVADGHRPARPESPRVVRYAANAPNSALAQLLATITAGTAPDAVVVPAVWVPELAGIGAIVPLDEDPDPVEALWVPDALTAMWQHDGESYGIPMGVDLVGLVVRREALTSIGGRPPAVWGDLRSICVAARDLMPDVRSPFVMPAGAPGGADTATATWLLLAAAGGGSGGAGPLDMRRAGTAAFTFLRRLIDTGLMSPDVVRLTGDAVVTELRSGRAVAGVAARSALDDEGLLFTGFPAGEGAGSEPTTLAAGLVGVVTTQSPNREAAIRRLGALRSASRRPGVGGALLATAQAPPVTPHHRLLASAARDVIESVVSGSAGVDDAMRSFGVVVGLLTG